MSENHVSGVMPRKAIERRQRSKVKQRPRQNRGLSQSTLETLGELHWYLARVPSGKEFVAERILDDAGVIVFVPIETRFRRKNRYRKVKTEIKLPLVPGYVLVGFVPGELRWGKLFRFRLIHGVVGRDGRPSRLPSHEVTRLLTRHTAGEFLAPKAQQWMQTYREFSVGDRVEVLDGPFEGHVFDVTKITGQNAKMVIDLLGTEQTIDVPISSLAKVS
jgi:transcription antitermination factor NusG